MFGIFSSVNVFHFHSCVSISDDIGMQERCRRDHVAFSPHLCRNLRWSLSLGALIRHPIGFMMRVLSKNETGGMISAHAGLPFNFRLFAGARG
jgi:hypothetical protein